MNVQNNLYVCNEGREVRQKVMEKQTRINWQKQGSELSGSPSGSAAPYWIAKVEPCFNLQTEWQPTSRSIGLDVKNPEFGTSQQAGRKQRTVCAHSTFF